jgi:hypothetical protein
MIDKRAGKKTESKRDYAGRQEGVTGVQMLPMRQVIAPVKQRGSGAARLGSSRNIGWAARMDHGDI